MISIPDKNIILIGFMASGKSHLGRIIAAHLGFRLIDLDSLIEAEEGRSIKQIFEQSGEAYFRDREYKMLKQLECASDIVLVTGGGTPTHFASAQLLPRIGMIFYLDASFELVKRRLQRSSKRPLGHASSEEEVVRLYELYRFRRPIYKTLGQSINVDKEESNASAKAIISRFHARNELNSLRHIRVEDFQKPYDIYFGEHALTRLPAIIASVGLLDHKLALITSTHLAGILATRIEELMGACDKKPVLITIKDGEEHKNESAAKAIHEQLFEHGFTRSSLVVALGGGTVGDVAGFAASTYMRGLPLMQVPTTLLAMVDSSVGGKTGIDTSAGKNLIGSFHMPKAVLIDPSLLSTLPPDEYACGMAEAIKHTIIGDKELFYELINQQLSATDLIERAVLVKVRAVIEDPHEHHRRATLNLGHTFAHAIEQASQYKVKHGQAVAMGLMLATKLAKRMGLLEEDFTQDLKSLLIRYHLPHTLPRDLSAQTLLSAMKHDKKRDQAGLRFIVPQKLGSVCIKHVPEDTVLEILRESSASQNE